MDHVIAVRLRMKDGSNRYFVTLGRIQDAVDGAPVAALVLEHSRRYDLQGTAVSAEVCEMLRQASDSAEAPYFYESLLAVSRQCIPFGDGYRKWRKRMAKEMAEGKHVSYCGGPARIETGADL